MAKHVLLSGPLCAGKTTVALELEAQFGFRVVSARTIIRQLAREDARDRRGLQDAGEALESATNGRWLSDAVALAFAAAPSTALLVIDSVRTQAQHRGLIDVLQPVVAVHLTASESELRRRFGIKRDPAISEAASFDEAMDTEIERRADALKELADVIIDTTAMCVPEMVSAVEVAVGASAVMQEE